MAWTRLTASTTADANDIHDNLTLIRSGDLLPVKLSDTASYTTGSYDLGSATYKWNELHINHAYISGIDDLVYQTTTVDTVTSIVASSLGQNTKRFRIMFYLNLSAAAAGTLELGFIFNSDSGSSYYSRMINIGVSNTSTSAITTDLRVLSKNVTSAAYKAKGEFDINYSSSYCVLSGNLSLYNTVGTDSQWMVTGIWHTTTLSYPTITSIKLISNISILTSSTLQIWRNEF